MNKYLFPVYRALVPKPLRTYFLKKDLRKKILFHFSHLPENEINDEQKEVLNYLLENPVSIFPYSFSKNYSPGLVEVFHDNENHLKYVLHEGKKLYFKKRWSTKRIQRAYADLSREQDPLSPHRYLSENFSLGSADVVADIGAAEGNFSLSAIEVVKKIYLVEYDREWIQALKATFAPWKEKVEIIGKYLSDNDTEKNMRLDTLTGTYPDISFIKIDVDGFEQKVLSGAGKTLSVPSRLKIALCTYHKHDDETDFTRLLEGKGFKVSPSKGYMIHYYDKKIRKPWLRRGLIRAAR